jgi:hypothetical protein
MKSLRSNIGAEELRNAPAPEPRILRVTVEDIDALCEVIREFQEQV